jgi:hypothetical protein
MSGCKFPGPWRVEPDAGGRFVVRDSNGFALVYINSSSNGEYLTPAEALVIAQAISKLPAARLGRFWRDFLA